MAHTKDYILNECKNAMANPSTFYQQPFVNYRGRTTDTGELYNEVVAEYVCNHIDEFIDGIKRITREETYKTESHTGEHIPSDDRLEEKIAVKIFNQGKKENLDFVGKMIDYQTPLKNKRDEDNKGVGKIDLLAYDGTTLYILELKEPDSDETMLRCVFEGFTYLKTLDAEKLLVDFKLPLSTRVVSCPFVFWGRCQNDEMNEDRPWLKKVMNLLNSKPYYIKEENGKYFVTDKGKIMGKYNSSERRIKPLMNAIEDDPQNFEKFLSVIRITGLGVPKEYAYADDQSGKKEKALKPTKNHLLGLIEYLFGKQADNYSVSGKNREDLLNGVEAAKKSAISEIEKNYENLPAKAWYIFEGHTYPDLYIEGDDYIIICEGKWTEPHITTETTYLKTAKGEYRNQMVRHIQGALNSAGNKKVYAFYIVDENCGYTKDLEKDSFAEQVEKETISLSYSEKMDVISSYCGYTTWQKLAAVIDVKFLTKDEIDKLS
ncbi:MAG: hypothetical protein IJE14_02610 [Clostridia bacterium]|nr:hypothetical protein [Clostridia bacterium]